MINDLFSFSSTITKSITQFGRAVLAAQYPDEFEYYGLQFELQNSKGVVKDTIFFPVMPNQISESEVNLVNVKKSSTAVISLINTTFAIKQISIGGTFGRKARILIIDTPKRNQSPTQHATATQFSAKIKTGYGVLKLIEKMIAKSLSADEYGQPHFLFIYNFSLGNNYLVEVSDKSFNMSLENNMMWNYQINMKAIATAESAKARIGGKNDSLQKRMMIDAINKNVNALVSNLTNINQTQAAVANTFTLLKRRRR